MLFEDPYKNIHGQTVDTPNMSTSSSNQPSFHMREASDVNTEAVGNAIKSVVVIIIFFSIFAMGASMIVSFFNDVNEDIPKINHTTGYYGGAEPQRENYAVNEIGEKFSFANETVTFTETDSIKAQLIYNNIVYVTSKTESGRFTLTAKATPDGFAQIALYRSRCFSDKSINCEVINNEYHKTDHLETIVYETNGDTSNYTYYFAAGYTMVELSFSADSHITRDDAKYIPIIKEVRNSFSKGDGTPDAFEMATKLDLPMDKKIASKDDVSIIDLSTKQVIFRSDTYNFIVTYDTFTSRSATVLIDQDKDMSLLILKRSNDDNTYYVFNNGDKSKNYYMIVEQKQPYKLLTTKEELLEALATLAD